jgi:hypothetical protein
MSMQITPTKRISTKVRSEQARHATVVRDKIADMAISQTQKTFLAWYAMPTVSGLAEVIHALYYLPQNFMLMLPHMVTEEGTITNIVSQSPFANRVQYYKNEGSSQDEPSLLADAVIRDCTDSSLVIVPAQYEDSAAQVNNFKVNCRPEAIASALLDIARVA